ncbi:glycoside hydrolase family 130 protein [Thermoanaerobacter sp. CM-CNRG TB177]|jgi:beta-1,4-mannooligosaccharide/beta-1,4-mannosyl-N-acetylglucosamine phosphorylase|uniref:glycoside hydrolase family 130 protein n=1 Tax=Thermoanaerobacter sp. CM-CNRG TB177 TaxID=2800659 RepID=UPI001BDE761C|nr:glycoside hydrolase family 130 protein [Thermoanaerobacter sp. CM-CNRG TB177]MBT1280492.1 glycoside hydrolase family 130 protein [Thermoanaerobacter sp. CM-CNRG TB177]MBZ4656850.1 glycosylase [Thermoanaerobacter sp.]
MNKVKIIGESLKNMPWEDKPQNYEGVVWRHSNNPIINWNPTKKTARIFNSAVIPFEGKFVGIFRADHKDGKPQLHVGWSEDGLKWEIEDEEIHWIDEEGHPYQPNYAYDPRLVKIDDTYYIIWCTDFSGAALGLGMTKDFKKFIRLENPFLPFNRNGVLFPRKINGKYLLLSRPSDNGHTPFGDIFISESSDLVYWGRHRKVMSRGGSGWWQSVKIGAGPIPIETTEGWLLFYHGVTGTCNGFVYSMGAAILDKDNPAKVLYRSKNYLLTPEMDYETKGFVPNVVFPCATVQDAETGRIAIYYGAADTYVAVAYTQVNELVEYIKENSDLVEGDDREYK